MTVARVETLKVQKLKVEASKRCRFCQGYGMPESGAIATF
jgi:hypothetical protein